MLKESRATSRHGLPSDWLNDGVKGFLPVCGFTSVDEALDQVQSIYPHQPIPPRAQYLLYELFPGTAGQD